MLDLASPSQYTARLSFSNVKLNYSVVMYIHLFTGSQGQLGLRRITGTLTQISWPFKRS